MLGLLIKQPNGLYCSCDYGGRVHSYNLTEKAIIDLYIESAKIALKKAEDYNGGDLIAKTVYTGGFEEELRPIPDNVLKEMGFEKTYDEMIKFVSRKPTNTSYCERDFTTYGKCPCCGEGVKEGWAGTDKQCKKCGQILKWE